MRHHQGAPEVAGQYYPATSGAGAAGPGPAPRLTAIFLSRNHQMDDWDGDFGDDSSDSSLMSDPYGSGQFRRSQAFWSQGSGRFRAGAVQVQAPPQAPLARDPRQLYSWKSPQQKRWDMEQATEKKKVAVLRRKAWAYVRAQYPQKTRDWQAGFVQAIVDEVDDQFISKEDFY